MTQSLTPTGPTEHLLAAATPSVAVPFRLSTPLANDRLAEFNQRQEIAWFGLLGHLSFPGEVAVRFTNVHAGLLGGAGVAAMNGGVIAAGFDGACVLAALMQYEVKAVLTLTLQVQYLRVAKYSDSLEYRAWVTKSARHVSFVQSVLIDRAASPPLPIATGSATLSPAGA